MLVTPGLGKRQRCFAGRSVVIGGMSESSEAQRNGIERVTDVRRSVMEGEMH